MPTAYEILNVSPDTNYQGCLDKNTLFALYVRQIFDRLDHQVTEPAIILHYLLNSYLESCQSIFTFWGWNRSHIPLVKELYATLHTSLETAETNAYETKLKISPSEIETYKGKHEITKVQQAAMKQGLLNVFQLLEKTNAEFNPKGELIELFNAFFSVYPLHLSDLKNCKLKEKICLTEVDTAVFKNILVKTMQARIEQEDSRIFSDEDMSLALATETIDKLIETLIKALSLSNDPDKKNILHQSLKIIAMQATPAQIEKWILPYILGKLKDALDLSETKIIYSLLEICIKNVTNNDEIHRILSSIINAPHQQKQYYITESLTEIALRIDKPEIGKTILPLLLSNMNSDNHSINSAIYKAFTKLLPLINPLLLKEKLAPRILRDLEDHLTLCPEIYELYEAIFSLAQDTASSLSSRSLFLMQTANMLRPKIKENYEEALADLKGKNTKKMLEAFEELNDQLLNFLSAETLKKDILPIALQKISHPDIAIRAAIFKTLRLLADFSDDKVPVLFKKTIFLCLKDQFTNELTLPLLKALRHYIQFCDDKETLLAIRSKLYAKANFKEQNTLNPFNAAILEALDETIKYGDTFNLDILALDIFHTLDFSQSSPEALHVFETVLKKCHPDFIKQSMLAELLKQVGFMRENVTQLIIKFIPLLSYEESIFYTRQILNSFEQSEAAKFSKVNILCELYKHHKMKIHEHEKQMQAENVPQTESSFTPNNVPASVLSNACTC